MLNGKQEEVLVAQEIDMRHDRADVHSRVSVLVEMSGMTVTQH
jgi:hypothetical protein